MMSPDLVRVYDLKQGDWVLFEGVKKPSPYYNNFYRIISVTRLETLVNPRNSSATGAQSNTNTQDIKSHSNPVPSIPAPSSVTFTTAKRLSSETDPTNSEQRTSPSRKGYRRQLLQKNQTLRDTCSTIFLVFDFLTTKYFLKKREIYIYILFTTQFNY